MTASDSARTISGRALALVWAVALVVWGLLFTRFFQASVEGVALDPVRRWLFLGVPLACLLVAFVASFRWARYRQIAPALESDASEGIARRSFLGHALLGSAVSLAGAAGAVLAALLPDRRYRWLTVVNPAVGARVPTQSATSDPAWEKSRVRAYRRLGRTGAQVSDISLGSAAIRPENGGEELARELIERGVNYFDTSPDYSASGSELALGRAMKGRRDEMFIATKFCTPQGHLPAGSSVESYMKVADDSLARLQTDRVDLIHIHACDSVERLLDPNVHEAFDRLKQAGKVRFLGVSTHTPNLEQVANAAIASTRFDVMMLAYHHGAWPQLAAIIERAAAADIGIVAMKTLKGAHHHGLLDLSEPERRSYPQAAFRWVLANPSVSSLVISFSKAQHADEYLFASGQQPESQDVALLAKYDRAIAGRHCFQHCGACLGACPEKLPIHDVLRHRMYFEQYGEQKEAMRLYAQLEKQADVCVGCSAPCAGACPFEIPIRERTIEAHALLTIGDGKRLGAQT